MFFRQFKCQNFRTLQPAEYHLSVIILLNIMALKHICNIVLVLNWFKNNLEVEGL